MHGSACVCIASEEVVVSASGSHCTGSGSTRNNAQAVSSLVVRLGHCWQGVSESTLLLRIARLAFSSCRFCTLDSMHTACCCRRRDGENQRVSCSLRVAIFWFLVHVSVRNRGVHTTPHCTHAFAYTSLEHFMRDVWLKGKTILCVCAKSFHLQSCVFWVFRLVRSLRFSLHQPVLSPDLPHQLHH